MGEKLTTLFHELLAPAYLFENSQKNLSGARSAQNFANVSTLAEKSREFLTWAAAVGQRWKRIKQTLQLPFCDLSTYLSTPSIPTLLAPWGTAIPDVGHATSNAQSIMTENCEKPKHEQRKIKTNSK